MAAGRGTTLTGQAGEYLVAAELCRRGFISTTFTANVPHYDIIASSEAGDHIPIQVKAIRKASWHFNISQFCEIELRGKRQIVGPEKPEPIQGLICVLVALREYGQDRFFICTWKQLRDLLVKKYRDYLDDHGGVRPQNPTTLHSGLKISEVEQFEGDWHVIEKAL